MKLFIEINDIIEIIISIVPHEYFIIPAHFSIWFLYFTFFFLFRDRAAYDIWQGGSFISPPFIFISKTVSLVSSVMFTLLDDFGTGFSCCLDWGGAAARHGSADLNNPGHRSVSQLRSERPSLPPLQSLCSFYMVGYLCLHETQFDSLKSAHPPHVICISYQFLINSYVFSDY